MSETFSTQDMKYTSRRNHAVEILCDQDRVQLIVDLLRERDQLRAEVIALQAVTMAMEPEMSPARYAPIADLAPEVL